MNDVELQVRGKSLARSVATREKALQVIRSVRQPPLIIALAPLLAIIIVSLALSGLQLPFWATVVISSGCVVSFSAIAALFHVYKQLYAMSDLLLSNEEQG